MILALLVLAPSSALAEWEFVVLVPERWQLSRSIDVTTLRRLFLGQRSEIGGRRIVCLAMPPGTRVREEFNRRVLGMTESRLTSDWIDQALQGGALPPEEVEDLEALAKRLRGTGLGIGYAARDEIGGRPPPGLKVLPLAGSPG